jgi:hypothetical protein
VGRANSARFSLEFHTVAVFRGVRGSLLLSATNNEQRQRGSVQAAIGNQESRNHESKRPKSDDEYNDQNGNIQKYREPIGNTLH